jgi:fructokinase
LFVVAGESLVDIVIPPEGEAEQAPGGSPLNVAVGLSRLGVDTLLVTELGDDARGRLVREHLSASGVRLHEPSVLAGRRTSAATARLDAAHSATYEFDLEWTLARRPLPPGATALHVGSIGAVLPPGRDAVADLAGQARSRGLLVSYDPNSRPALQPDQEQAFREVLELAARADLVKLSDEDVRTLAPGREPAEVAAQLLRDGPATRLVVVTYGGAGAEAFTSNRATRVRADPVPVVDTVGAGDAFMAGLLAALVGLGGDIDGVDLTALLSAAHAVAAVTCGRRGADPPTRAELPPGWPAV